MDKEIEIYYQRRGEDLVNALYDNGWLHPDLERASFSVLEDILAYLIQSNVEMAIFCREAQATYKDRMEKA